MVMGPFIVEDVIVVVESLFSHGKDGVVGRWKFQGESRVCGRNEKHLLDHLVVLVSFINREVWNHFIRSSACISSPFTHLFSNEGNPFHLMRYCKPHCLPFLHTSRIALISCSSCPSIKSGGG